MKRKAKYPKLAGWMAENGITRKALAIDLGISYNSLSRKMYGGNDFNLNEARAIIKLTGLPFEEVLM